MIVNIQDVLHTDLDVESGFGITQEQKDGTWLAVICIDNGNLGLYGSGATESHALEALKAKVKAIGGVCGAAYAEAESRYQVRKQAESAEYLKKLGDILGTSIPEVKAKVGEDN